MAQGQLPQNDKRTVEIDLKERLWLQQALTLQRAALIRKRGGEQPGSEIHGLRGKEILDIEQLQQKLA